MESAISSTLQQKIYGAKLNGLTPKGYRKQYARVSEGHHRLPPSSILLKSYAYYNIYNVTYLYDKHTHFI